MRFSDVQHQPRALAVLRRALASGRAAHAYLFDGPDGVGKELTARAFAARLLCEDDTRDPAADACGRCRSCRLVAGDNHPDLHLIHRRLHKLHPERLNRRRKGLFLSVDVVRHFLIAPAAIAPSAGRRRVFVVREAERMNDEAQNALLKTLEAPPGTACLVLVTSSATRLLPTVRSRCQVVPFDYLPTEFVAAELRRRTELPTADAEALAALAGGRLGVALRWHQLDLLRCLDNIVEALARLRGADVEAFGKSLVALATELAKRAAPAVDEYEEDEEDDVDEDDDEEEQRKPRRKAVPTDAVRDALKLLLLLIAALHRDALVVAGGAPALRQLAAQRACIDDLAGRWPLAQLDRDIHAVSEAEHMLDRNVAPQLVCERLGVALRGELPTA